MFWKKFIPQQPRLTYPRAHPREAAQGLGSDLGDVLDISEGGMRIRRNVLPVLQVGALVDVSVRSDSHKVRLKAQVRWVRRKGIKGWEVGFRWIGVHPTAIEKLIELARFGFVAPNTSPFPSSAAQNPPTPPPDTRQSEMRIEVEDLYKLLGVARDAAPEEIQSAYRRQARELHPDTNKSDDAAARFTMLNKAYAILRDEEKRRRYDEMLARHAA